MYIAEDQDRGKRTFTEVAGLYDRVRNRYPAELFADLIRLAKLDATSRVLEIGMGTGIATLPLAKLGCRIVGVELGAEMAEVARRKLAEYPNVDICVAAFEEWAPDGAQDRTPGETRDGSNGGVQDRTPGGARDETPGVMRDSAHDETLGVPRDEAQGEVTGDGLFDLVMSATAFHWIDPAIRFSKPATLLRPGGSLAIINYWHAAGGTGEFFERVQKFYELYMPGTEPGQKLTDPEEMVPETSDLESCGWFAKPEIRTYITEEIYTRGQYIDLLSTYSGHRTLDAGRRQRLFDAIGELIDRDYGGRISKCYLNELIVAEALSR